MESLINAIPTEVLEDVVCSFLDVKSLFSLLKINRSLRSILLSSSSVWENSLRSMIKHQEDEFKLSEKELNVGRVMRKLFDEFSLQIKEFKEKDTMSGIMNYLQEEEFRKVYDDHQENAYFFLICLFKAFSFDRSGFPLSIPSFINSYEHEAHHSCVDFTNNDHCFHSCHKNLNGDWETCIVGKKLIQEFRYFWAIHLTNYHNEGSNAWGIVIGIDDKENQSRNSTSSAIHYYIGKETSNGVGYCVHSHSKSYRGQCEYSRANNNNREGDVIGVEFYQKGLDVNMKFYTCFGDSIVDYQYSLAKDVVGFQPAVSIVSRMVVSILPWDGSVETLKKLA
ncbi:predicted protein [Naegleria gruberi]|uniref:Predicted protein n=1 Tax=Naegleria gruberi TaxID=5762 RepID=D2VGI6_NAEGR|nr:uncharacterized protein NAEGRDRAFT_67992 [Naegleria gruberi]EFC44072.1 predicted protein [Naegleria gruberi]|eukprot:XP_002676816.1 predicted protein [Naegleria gruberi strain NEG-M]